MEHLFVLASLSAFIPVAESTAVQFHPDADACPLGFFPCGNLTICLLQLFHCNGNVDCDNGADEENCVDDNGWPQLFNSFMKTKTEEPKECLLDVYPEQCTCESRKILCIQKDLEAVPAVSSNVTVLDLQGNRIQALPAGLFIRYKNLVNLMLQNNGIVDISNQAFSGLENLKKLFLHHNQIEVLKPGVFKELKSLDWLILDNNRISTVHQKSFTGLQSLFFLSLLNNSVKSLPRESFCEELPRLNWLDMEGNQIQYLRSKDFQECTIMTVLILRRNQIRGIERGVFSRMRLIELDLSMNQIKDLPPPLFRNQQSLKQLNISHNPLAHIYDNQFDGLINLHSLSMEGIEIPNIHNRMFRKMENLSHIYFKKFEYCGFSPNVRSCKPNTDGISSFENLLANIILRVFVWVVACITCFGNVFVICLRSCVVSENRHHAMSIMALCCADCLMGIYLFFIGTYDIRYCGEYNRHAQEWMESIQCQLIGSLAMLSTEVSVMLLTYMTVEKYLCIVFPFSPHRAGKKQTLFILITIWVLGFIIAVVPFFYKDSFGNYYGRNGVCFPLNSDQTEKLGASIYSTSIFLGLNLVAFVAIVFSYTTMFYSIRKTGAKTGERSVYQREVAIAKRFFFIVFTDALCWIPIFLLKLLSLLRVEFPGTITSWVVIFILPINSALNPILYTITTAAFQERLKHCLKAKWQQSSFKDSRHSMAMVSTHTTAE
ncbi:relaxin receptor 2 [Erpetoichthys calabaricus]|uniref:relaxin receptor 2 n=1 Tax=Erpetoichthys calabaricus TaxID=27687 RepID=UPI0010A048B7|nr:relaxin receptor 2 [Erpetoichthys calabaricus]